jgi:hypothetical protein
MLTAVHLLGLRVQILLGHGFVSRLRVFENRVLRRIFGPKGDEVTGEWRKHYN